MANLIMDFFEIVDDSGHLFFVQRAHPLLNRYYLTDIHKNQYALIKSSCGLWKVGYAVLHSYDDTEMDAMVMGILIDEYNSWSELFHSWVKGPQ